MQDNFSMNMDLEQMRQLLEQQQKELIKVKEDKEKLRSELQASEEKRHVLEETVKSHKEDFEHERKDRERTQSRLNDVETELSVIKRQQRQQQIRQMQDLNQRRQAALDFHKEEYHRNHPNVPEYMDIHLADGEGEDELDSGVGMTHSLYESDGVPDGFRTNSVNGSRGHYNGQSTVQNTRRFECDGYDEIDGGFGVEAVDEGGLDEDPNGAFECDNCKRRFGPSGFVSHMTSCTGK